MARIAGVNLPAQKHVWVGLQSIYGIGRTRSKKLCESAGVNSSTRIRDLSEPEVERLRAEVGKYVVEGDLRRETGKIGRAPCRERGCQTVWITVGAVSLKKE